MSNQKKENNLTAETETFEEVAEQKTEEQAEETAAAEKAEAGTRVYCGPSVRNVVRQYTVYSGEIPAALEKFMQEHPAARPLLVPLKDFAETRKNLETKGTAETALYKKVKSEL